MAMHDGAPRCAFGSMGGDSQAQIHVQLLARLVDDGADPQDALDAPRWCVEPSNWTLRAERGFTPEWFNGLRSRGHDPQPAPRVDAGMGHAHAIQRTAGGYAVATDPRAEGAALGL
jgi:gamma-glutamyltranspeptidase/glutathione hydrolase